MIQRRRFLSLLSVSALAPLGAEALTIQEVAHPLQPAPVRGGALSWDVLGLAKDFRYPVEVQALDGQVVTLSGYMFPWEPGPAHTRFFIGANAWHCASCATRDWTQLVDAQADEAQPFRDTPVLVQGRLALVEDAGPLVYRLTGARLIG